MFLILLFFARHSADEDREEPTLAGVVFFEDDPASVDPQVGVNDHEDLVLHELGILLGIVEADVEWRAESAAALDMAALETWRESRIAANDQD